MKTRYQLLIAILLVALLILSRVYSPVTNFTAVGAVAIFSGFLLGAKRGIAVIFSGMLLSDVLSEGLYDAGTMIAVYLALFTCVLIGQKKINFGFSSVKINGLLSVFTKAISAGVVFYLISNLGVWLFSGMYAINIGGLLECYVLAIPFFKFTWLGDVSFSLLLFGSYYAITELQTVQSLKNEIVK